VTIAIKQARSLFGGSTVVELRDLRLAGAMMLPAALILPALPGHPGLPCPLRTLTGVPCPLCGMTTSVEDTMHGHLGAALAANPMGIVAVGVSAALIAFRPANVVVSRLAMAGTLAAMWLFELNRFGFL
jgi:hypothetical protein